MKKKDQFFVVAKIFFEQLDMIHFQSNFYLYNEGIWRLESRENTKSWINKVYQTQFGEVLLKKDLDEITYLIEHLTYEKYRKSIKYLDSKEKRNTINVKDGILNLDSLVLKPFEREDFAFHKLPFNFIEEPHCPVMGKFLTTSMHFPEKVEPEGRAEYTLVMNFIQEWMGYTLLPGNPYEKALLLYGEGRNGKGVLQHIWGRIVGPSNVSHVDIRDINNGTESFLTRNKLINFSHDLENGQQLDTGTIKAAISGEHIIMKEKYKPQYQMEFTAKMIIACNSLPFVRNVGAAIRERFYLLPFTRVFTESERDPNLKQKLEKEIEEIFSWSVIGLRRLMKRGHFIAPERCLALGEKYAKENDSVSMWIDEDNIMDEDSRVERQRAWSAYKYYCEQSGFRPGGKVKFYQRIERKGVETLKTNGVVFFLGMKLPNQITN